MDPEYIILICAGAVVIVALVIIAVLKRKNRRLKDGTRAEDVKVIDGVRYSKSDVIESGGEAAVTHRPGDFVLAQGKSVRAVQGGTFLPGKYTVLATGDQTQTFKLRLGGYVREYRHGDEVVIGDGETVSAVSCSVIFR